MNRIEVSLAPSLCAFQADDIALRRGVPVEFNVVDRVARPGGDLWGGDAELFADGSGGACRDLTVAGNGCAPVVERMAPDAVPGALAEKLTPVDGEVPFEVASVQAAARSIVIDST